jgi:TRAP transporter 4TM/12TM fusion protein
VSDAHLPDAEPFPASGAAKLCSDILQALLVGCVVAWVLDVPRRVFGLAFYTEQFLALVLGLGLALAYVSAASRERWWDFVAAAVAFGICGYIAIRYPDLSNELAMLPADGIIGSAILIFLVLEATRRTAGAVLIVIILVMTAYVFIGPHMPNEFATRPVSVLRLLVYLGLDINSMIGSILGVAAVIVIPFTIMGSVLARTGGSDFFADLAMSAMGRYRGGAAKIAVVGSGLFGMISGAAVSNVMAVGIVTIPLMQRSGFSPYRAGAIEAVGSTGGQLMPPVMGAAAFIMAEFLQVPYSAVVIAAILPSLLYYGTLFICVDLEAAKHKIGSARVENAPTFMEVLRAGWHFIVPLGFLIVGLLWLEIPAERAALYSTGILIVLNFVFGYRGKKVGVHEMFRAVIEAGRASLDIILIGAAAGLVVGILNITGLAFGLTLQLISVSGDSVLVLLMLTAAVSFVLGMGMPTVGVYVLTATLVAPALIKLGVNPTAAHMFVMYNGMLSMITPPVALAAYAAANIARVSGWKTGWVAVSFGWSTFILPFLFVGSPTLLMQGPAVEIIWDFGRTLLGIYVGSMAVIGYSFAPLRPTGRLIYGVTAIVVLLPQLLNAAIELLLSPLLLIVGRPSAISLEVATAAAGGALLIADFLRQRTLRGAAAAA